MKTYSAAALAAFKAGTAIVTGAVYIACSPTPVAGWGGYWPVTIDGVTFTPLGDAALFNVSAGALGGAEQKVELSLNSLDPAVLNLLDAPGANRAPAVLYRVVLDQTGTSILDAMVYWRGRLDSLSTRVDANNLASIKVLIEGAARGLGRSRGRLASHQDQILLDPADNGLGFEDISYSGQKVLYWGGKPPAQAGQALPGVSTQEAVQYAADNLWRL